jgi:hypothetical protein
MDQDCQELLTDPFFTFRKPNRKTNWFDYAGRAERRRRYDDLAGRSNASPDARALAARNSVVSVRYFAIVPEDSSLAVVLSIHYSMAFLA